MFTPTGAVARFSLPGTSLSCPFHGFQHLRAIPPVTGNEVEHMGKINDSENDEISEQLEALAGRRAPFSQVGDWILLAPISKQAKLLYWALKAHVNTSRGDSKAWPSQDMLAELLGFAPIKDDDAQRRDGRKIRPYLKELQAIGAIEAKPGRRYAGQMRQRTVYLIHEEPPPDYEGMTRLDQFHKSRKLRIAKAEAAKRARDEADKAVQETLDLGPTG